MSTETTISADPAMACDVGSLLQEIDPTLGDIHP
jgi:hypothetical protein